MGRAGIHRRAGALMAWYFFPRMLASAMTIVVLVVLTRVLGPADFGRYNITLVFGTVGYSFIFAWLAAAIVRFHNTPEFAGKVVANVLDTGIKLTLLLIPVVGLGYFLVPVDYRFAFFLGAIFCVAHSMQEVGLAGLRVYNSGPAYGAVTVVRPALGVLLVLVFVAFGGGYVSAVAGMSLGAAITGVYALNKVHKRSGLEKASREKLKSFFIFGEPLAVVTSGSMLIVLLSQFYLALFLDLGAVGIFAAAQTLAMRSIAMPMAMLSRASAASIFHAYEVGGHDASGRELTRHFSYLMLISVPIAATLIFANDTVSMIMFGKVYKATVSRQLPLLAIAAFITGVQGAYFAYAFTLSRKTVTQVFIMIGTTLAHAVISPVTIYFLGGLGASLAVLLTGILSSFTYIYLGRAHFPVSIPFEEFWKTGAAALAYVPFAIAADYQSSMPWAVTLLILGLIVFSAVLGVVRQAGFMIALSKFQSVYRKYSKS